MNNISSCSARGGAEVLQSQQLLQIEIVVVNQGAAYASLNPQEQTRSFFRVSAVTSECSRVVRARVNGLRNVMCD